MSKFRSCEDDDLEAMALIVLFIGGVLLVMTIFL